VGVFKSEIPQRSKNTILENDWTECNYLGNTLSAENQFEQKKRNIL